MSYRDKIIARVESIIMDHAYAGDGMCSCGSAIGYSDGIAWTVFLEHHQAVKIVSSFESSLDTSFFD